MRRYVLAFLVINWFFIYCFLFTKITRDNGSWVARVLPFSSGFRAKPIFFSCEVLIFAIYTTNNAYRLTTVFRIIDNSLCKHAAYGFLRCVIPTACPMSNYTWHLIALLKIFIFLFNFSKVTLTMYKSTLDVANAFVFKM